MQSLKLIKTLLIASLKSRYRQTFSGFAWVVLNPIILFTAQSFVFSEILKIKIPNYLLFLLSGLLPWLFLVQTIEMSTHLLVTNHRLLKAFSFQPLVLIIVQSLDSLLSFTTAFLILFFFMLFSGYNIPITAFLLPIPLIILWLFVSSSAFLLSLANVFFRDVRFIVSFVLNISFFLTPVFYPISAIPVKFQALAQLNPFYIIILPFRLCLTTSTTGSLGGALINAFSLAISMTLITLWFWNTKRNNVYYRI